MSAGELRERVAIKRLVKTRRNDGGYDKTLQTVTTRWAKVVPVGGRESEQSGRLRGATTYHVTIRRYADFTSEDHLTWGDINMNIREIHQAGNRAEYLKIVAESGAVL